MFTVQFKKKCFEVLRNSQNIEQIMLALEQEDILSFRIQLEITLDKIKETLEYREILNDSQDIFIWNSIVQCYKEVQKIYSEFMENYTSELDLIAKNTMYDKK